MFKSMESSTCHQTPIPCSFPLTIRVRRRCKGTLWVLRNGYLDSVWIGIFRKKTYFCVNFYKKTCVHPTNFSAAKAPYLAVFKMRISTVETVERIAMDYYKQEIEAEEQQKPRPAIPLLKADDQHGFSKRDPTIDKKAAIFKVIFLEPQK